MKTIQTFGVIGFYDVPKSMPSCLNKKRKLFNYELSARLKQQ